MKNRCSLLLFFYLEGILVILSSPQTLNCIDFATLPKGFSSCIKTESLVLKKQFSKLAVCAQ